MDTALYRDIAAVVERISFIDTHEHLFEESFRINRDQTAQPTMLPSDDFSLLFFNYANADLISAGMSRTDVARFWQTGVDLEEKWRLIAPYYPFIRLTGYGHAIRESLNILFEVDDLNEQTYFQVSDGIRNGLQPGFYRHILKDVAHVEYAHVNAVEPDGSLPIFRKTEQPDLLKQDLSTVSLSTGLDIAKIEAWFGNPVLTLTDMHDAIDAVFAAYGPIAIATKNQCAYHRRLLFDLVSDEEAAPLFERFRQQSNPLNPVEQKALEDHLFHYCIKKASDYGLVVKLHSGYFAGTGGMPLDHVRKNASDICLLLRQYPATRFDIFHINYPYQDEAIALAKHYPNAFVDMCWAWIVNPQASVRFLKEFLRAAPINKLFTFAGDYRMIELLPGHARIARDGITLALTELVEEGAIAIEDVPFVAARIMRDNAKETFEHRENLARQIQ